MALDPVHFDGIEMLTRRVDADYDDSGQADVAEELWRALESLFLDGERKLSPVESLERRRAPVEEMALVDDEYPTQHGLDSGTLNPVAFTNGLVVDVAHAAMASVPTDLDLHRIRTVVESVYSGDTSVSLRDEAVSFDGDAAEGHVVQVPARLQRLQNEVVHGYALYLAESRHALANLDEVDDLLFLDGSLYPKGVVKWVGEGEDVVGDCALTWEVLENYTRLVERAVEKETPVVGFVKNTSSAQVVRAFDGCPWMDDASFFRRALSDGGEGLTYSNWFLSEFLVDRGDPFASHPAEWVDGDLDAEDYRPCFMVVRDPRDDLVLKAEAPYAFVRDDAIRGKLTRQLLKEVALNGAPRAVSKADALARVERGQRKELLRALEESLGVERDRGFDEERWGYVRSSMGLTL